MAIIAGKIGSSFTDRITYNVFDMDSESCFFPATRESSEGGDMKANVWKMCTGVALTALGTGFQAAPSWAQDQAPAASGDRSAAQSPDSPAEQSNGDIVVTGSLIRRPDLKSNSPVTYVNAGEIRYQGATTTDQILARLPQFTADANEYQSNGSDGTANINLRGLGPNRTLVLIDGRRMMSSQAIDLNFVPSLLIKRVDVVTGGGSAVYGSDALSGVVNFILDNDLNGLKADAQSGFAQHDNGNAYLRSLQVARGYPTAPSNTVDGERYILNFAAGKNFADGRGNITAYGGYRRADPVTQDTRDYSACALNQVDSATTLGTGFACGGSSNTPYGTFAPLSGPNAGSGYYSNAKDGSKSFVPYDSSFAYNYTPTNYIQRADDRYTAGAQAHFKFIPAVEAYGSFMFMRDDSISHAAPSAFFLGTTFNIPCNNPLLSASQATFLCGAGAGTNASAQALIGYRLADFPRTGILRHDDYRYTGGLRGDFGKESYGATITISGARQLG